MEPASNRDSLRVVDVAGAVMTSYQTVLRRLPGQLRTDRKITQRPSPDEMAKLAQLGFQGRGSTPGPRLATDLDQRRAERCTDRTPRSSRRSPGGLSGETLRAWAPPAVAHQVRLGTVG